MKWALRVLVALVGLCFLAVAGLWLAGFRAGAGDGAASVEINRPAAQVWRFLIDDALVKKWVGGLAEVHPEPGSPDGVGWRARMIVEMDGERFELDWKTTAFEPNRHIGFVVQSAPGASVGFVEKGEYRLEEKDGRTKLTLSAHSEYTGWFPRLLEPIITPSGQKKVSEDLARLKSLVEAEPVQ